MHDSARKKGYILRVVKESQDFVFLTGKKIFAKSRKPLFVLLLPVSRG